MAYNPNPSAQYAGLNMNKFGDEESARKYAMQHGYLIGKDTGNKDLGVQFAYQAFQAWKLNPQRQQDAKAAEIFKNSKGLFAKGAMPRLRVRTPEEFRLSNGGLQDVRIPLTQTQQSAARVGAQMAAGGLNIPVG